MRNAEVAAVLEEIGRLLELKGENPFKCRAYFQAARRIQEHSEPVAELAASGRLGELPGIGAALSQKITELVASGRLGYLEQLRQELPAGLKDLLTIPELGPKKVSRLFRELGITDTTSLEQALDQGRIAALPGFGGRSVDNLRRGLSLRRQLAGRVRLGTALPVAEAIRARLRRVPGVVQVEIAGSVRRARETCKDLDLVVAAAAAEQVMDAFVGLPEIATVAERGPTKCSVLLRAGLPADLRVVEPAAFAAALQYFTGSKEHNSALRGLAKRLGLKLNEYGLFRGDRRLELADEADLYAALGLSLVPPELRENQGEIERAQAGDPFRLLAAADLRGLVHCHSNWSDGKAAIDALAQACRELGFEYLVLTDHSQSAVYAGGLTPQRVRQQWAELERLNRRLAPFRIFKGIEADILATGELDYDDALLAGFEVVIGSIHSRFKLPAEAMTERLRRALEHPRLRILGHPTGRLLLERDGYACDFEAVLATAARERKVLEINCHPHRLDLDATMARHAHREGIRLSLGPDAHDLDGLSDLRLGVGTARRAGLGPEALLNTLPLKEFEAWAAGR